MASTSTATSMTSSTCSDSDTKLRNHRHLVDTDATALSTLAMWDHVCINRMDVVALSLERFRSQSNTFAVESRKVTLKTLLDVSLIDICGLTTLSYPYFLPHAMDYSGLRFLRDD